MKNYQLDLDNRYNCPICLHGEISCMPLMEAMSCNFCNHIFTIDAQAQILKLADSQLPIVWYWNGRRWQSIERKSTRANFNLVYGIFSLAFVILPTLIMGIAAYIFPPLPDSPLSWLPLLWTIITFLTHLLILVWLIIQYLQFPLILYLRSIVNRLVNFSR